MCYMDGGEGWRVRSAWKLPDMIFFDISIVVNFFIIFLLITPTKRAGTKCIRDACRLECNHNFSLVFNMNRSIIMKQNNILKTPSISVVRPKF